MISDRLFSALDRNRNNYVDVLEFIEGMTILFSENFEKLAKFIFNFYDFNKDGLISKEDIRVVLSYIPLNLKPSSKFSNAKLKFEKEDFKDRVESQDELFLLLEKCFESADLLDHAKFLSVVENVSSDIFLYILIFLMDKKPFSNTTLKQFKGWKFECTAIRINLTPQFHSRLIASPNLNSKFSPSITIKKSPMMSRRITLDSDANHVKKFGSNVKDISNTAESKNFLLKFAGANANNAMVNGISGIKKSGNVNFSSNSADYYDKDNGNSLEIAGINGNRKDKVNRVNFVDSGEVNIDENENFKGIRVNRKIRNDLNNLEESNVLKKSKFSDIDKRSDLPIVPGLKHQKIRSSHKLETFKYFYFY